MEILEDLPIGLKYRGLMVGETVRLAGTQEPHIKQLLRRCREARHPPCEGREPRSHYQ